MYYMVVDIHIGRLFLKEGCYSQPIISAVVKKSLIPNNLTERAPETQNFKTLTPNVTPNQIKQM